MPADPGYYRSPTLHKDGIVFVAEDDLWEVSTEGGEARRLTANPGRASHPCLSPDGRRLAFISQDEGSPEVYVTSRDESGPARRVSYLGSSTRIAGWSRDGSRIRIMTDAERPFAGDWHLWDASPDRVELVPQPWGPALALAEARSGKGRVIWRNGGGRNTGDPAWWKRYRGGRAGQLWIDPKEDGEFRPLVQLEGDLAHPMWIGRRVYFLSDHEGVANVYSCRPTGRDLVRHSHHTDFYVRSPRTDGRRIVYTAGGEIFLLDPKESASRRLAVFTTGSRPQRNRKFVPAARHLQHYALHPDGHSLCVTTRGKPFCLAHWEGAVSQLGRRDGVRYRCAQWLPDGQRIVAVSDESGEERLVVFSADGKERTVGTEFGRVDRLAVSPAGADRVALTNHRNEIHIVDLGSRKSTLVEKSRYGVVPGIDWSPDGRWLAYALPTSRVTTVLTVYSTDSGKKHPVSNPDFRDRDPAFDPSGDYLYFISTRQFDPVYDSHIFDLGFPRGQGIFAIPLRKELLSPFDPRPRPPQDDSRRKPKRIRRPKRVRIDLKGISDRAVACPIPEGRIDGLRALPDRLVFTTLPIQGARGRNLQNRFAARADARLESYDLVEKRREVLVEGVGSFDISLGGDALVYQRGAQLRVLPAGQKPKRGVGDRPSRSTGWIDLGRVKVSVDPAAEWRQMFLEAWRLQRDHFWNPQMSGVDWEAMRDRYTPLLDRVSTRSDLSDLLWELQGELGTSHAYEMGGDHRPQPRYRQGFLGADLAYDGRARTWRVKRVPRGDSWLRGSTSPLAAPGINAEPNTRLIAVGGRAVSRDCTPGECLVHRADEVIAITLADSAGRKVRTVEVQTLASEEALRYRDWVEENRERVHRDSKGRVGYLHIPDMGPAGFAEFHRYFLAEVDHDGLVIDVRYNRGGHVSQLLLEKLLRRRIGYGVPRWHAPYTYPAFAPAGAMAAVTNERAGSDGDIFSHAFKAYGLGPLVGTRTWGGVVGVNPRHGLVDGGLTTQPEFGFWWFDVGYDVENYGTDPDIEVINRPQDYAAGRDPQLARGLQEVLRILEESPPPSPELSKRPKVSRPRLSRKKKS